MILLLILFTSVAWANPAQPVPIPDEPSLAPQLEIDAVGIATLKAGNPGAQADFSDSSVLLGAAQRLFDESVGSLVLGGTLPEDAISGQTSFFLHQALVDYQSERWELALGRSDQPSAHLVDFPTLRGDDLLTLTNPLNPYSRGGATLNPEEARYANVAELSFNQGQVAYESVYAEHLLGDPTDTRINAFGATFEYLAPPGLEELERVPEWGASYRHVALGDGGLHQLEAGAVVTLHESVTDRVDLRAQEILSLGGKVSALASPTDVAAARSSSLAASVRYLHSPFGKPGWQVALTGGLRSLFDVADASSSGFAVTALKRLGRGFDVVFEYLGQWRAGALAAVESPGTSYEQSGQVGLVFNFEATLNSHVTARRRLLNMQHEYVPN